MAEQELVGFLSLLERQSYRIDHIRHIGVQCQVRDSEIKHVEAKVSLTVVVDRKPHALRDSHQ